MWPARLMAVPATAMMREPEAIIRAALRNQMRMLAADPMKINLKNLRSSAGYGGLYKI